MRSFLNYYLNIHKCATVFANYIPTDKEIIKSSIKLF